MSDFLEQVIIKMGFSSQAEFTDMVSKCDLSTAEKMTKFRNWQGGDGTKEGLQKLLDEQSGETGL